MDIKAIYEQVKENHQKLESCRLHDFSIDLDTEKKVGKRWQCANCHGEVNTTDKSWYETGLKHSKGTAKAFEEAIAKGYTIVVANAQIAKQLSKQFRNGKFVPIRSDATRFDGIRGIFVDESLIDHAEIKELKKYHLNFEVGKVPANV